MPQPVYDDENDTSKIAGDTEPQTSIDAPKTKRDSTDEIAQKEDSFSRESTPKKNGQDPDSEIEPTDLYNPGKAIGSKTPFSGFQAYFGQRKKGFFAGGIFGFLAILTMLGIGGVVPYELVHIKEVVAQNIGGIQENVVDKRRMRVLQKAYFFRDDGKFAGYKQKGTLFSFLDNRKSNRLVSDLEAKGYKIDPELKDGKWTGKFKSIVGPDGVKINDSDSLWSRRSAIRSVVNETYPAKSALWRNRQTNLMYKRYGLERGKWWTDNEATRKIASAKERLKEKIRTAMRTDPSTRVGVKGAEAQANKDGTVPPDKSARANDINGPIQDAIDQEKAAVASGADVSPINGDVTKALEENPAKAVGSGVANVIKITGVADTSCQIIGTANTIAKTSRAAKALQLAKYSSLILSVADGVKAGQVDGKTINDVMIAVNAMDPQTKKNFFGSGGWLSISSKSSHKSTYGTTYDAGGGFSGVIKNVLDKVYGFVGGKQNVQGTCGTLSNPFFSAGSFIVGIGAIIFTGGGVSVAELAAQAGLQVGKSFLIAYGTQLAIKAATGTIVDGSEQGERMGDAFSSGAGTMFAMNGASHGLKPLTQQEYALAQSQYEADKQAQIAQLPLKDRLFGLENTQSLSSKSLNTVASIQNSGVITTIAKIPSSFLGLFSAKTNAEDPSACTQEDIQNAHIQTDNFCNPVYGNTDTELDKIDPMDNLIWMYENKHVDENGQPLSGEFIDYTNKCFESQTVNPLFNDSNDFASEFISDCYDNGGGPAGSGISLNERFRAFRLDSGLLQCLNMYIDTGDCDEATADTANQDTSNPNIYLLGDSIGEGATSPGGLKEKLTANQWTNITIDAVCSRSLGGTTFTDCNGKQSKQGITVLNDPATASIIQPLGTFVLELGTNQCGGGGDAGYKTDLTNAVQKVHSINSNAKVFVVNLYTTTAGSKNGFAKCNEVINSLASSLNYTIIDWSKTAKDSYFTAGGSLGVHPSTAGGWDAYAKMIADAVGSPQINSTVPPNATAEEVFARCKNNTAAGKLKIVCATQDLNGLPYDSFDITKDNYNQRPPHLGCNSYANMAIARATNGKYIGNYCSGGYLRSGVSAGKFKQLVKNQVQPGDLLIHDEMPAGGDGCNTSGLGHVEVVVSYESKSGKVTTTGAHNNSSLSGLSSPRSLDDGYWSYGIEYIGGGL